MGRKAALTADQLLEAERRHLVDGESIRSLAKAYDVDEKTLRIKINPQKSAQEKSGKSLSALAIEKLAAEKQNAAITAEISALPAGRQIIVSDLMRKFESISEHMTTGAELNAETYSLLSAAANQSAKQARTDVPENFTIHMNKAADILAVANEAARTPMGLIVAHKDAVRDNLKRPPPESQGADLSNLTDDELNDLERLAHVAAG